MTTRWRIETQVTVRRVYFVEAEDCKTAEAASYEMTPDSEDVLTEETTSIVEVETVPA